LEGGKSEVDERETVDLLKRSLLGRECKRGGFVAGAEA
jgi:hypothetical protein